MWYVTPIDLWILQKYTNNERSEREIKETLPFTITSMKIWYLGINLLKEATDWYSENFKTDERNWKWDKRMEGYTMFLGEKNQYCQNNYTTQGNLQTQRDPYQITNDIFHRTKTKNFLIWKHKIPWVIKAI